jgi:S1-C subfamily serine protease
MARLGGDDRRDHLGVDDATLGAALPRRPDWRRRIAVQLSLADEPAHDVDDPQIAEQLGLETEEGTLVLSVVDGSVAERGGLKEGDVIVGLDGEEVASVEDLLAALRERDPGDEVVIDLLRNGERLEARVTLASRPEG